MQCKINENDQMSGRWYKQTNNADTQTHSNACTRTHNEVMWPHHVSCHILPAAINTESMQCYICQKQSHLEKQEESDRQVFPSLPCCGHRPQIPAVSRFLLAGPSGSSSGSEGTEETGSQTWQTHCPESPQPRLRWMRSTPWCLEDRGQRSEGEAGQRSCAQNTQATPKELIHANCHYSSTIKTKERLTLGCQELSKENSVQFINGTINKLPTVLGELHPGSRVCFFLPYFGDHREQWK